MPVDKDILIYTSNGWGPCHMVKVYLSRKGIPFIEYNVSTDIEARTRLIELGYRSTPVTIIGEETIVGYQPPKIEQALKFIQ